MKKYFNIVRVYPKIEIKSKSYGSTDESSDIKVYDWTSFTSEFLEMDGYDRWYLLRESNSIREIQDVFVLKDIDSSQINEIRYQLKDRLRQKLDELTDKAYNEFYYKVKNKKERTDTNYQLYDSTDKNTVDNAEEALDKATSDALETINKDFTDYLESNFTKLEF